MIIRFVKKIPNPEEIFRLTGIRVKRITAGYINISGDEKNPIFSEGVEIETEDELTEEQLAKLDSLFPNLKRL
jgi:hypothetical protein